MSLKTYCCKSESLLDNVICTYWTAVKVERKNYIPHSKLRFISLKWLSKYQDYFTFYCQNKFFLVIISLFHFWNRHLKVMYCIKHYTKLFIWGFCLPARLSRQMVVKEDHGLTPHKNPIPHEKHICRLC